MPRLTRKNIKVFAGSATNNGVFGSLQANNPTTTSDVEQLQSLSAWSEGWNAATETSEELPPLEEIQGVEYVTTYQQAYIMQEGVPEWAATVTYYKGCVAKEVTSTGFKIYNSLTDNNTGNLLSDTSNWKKVMDSDDLYAFDNTVVHNTGNETVAGVKTFSSSPIVPTATSGDSSTKAASTAFVANVASGLQTQINQKINTSDAVNLTGAQTITGAKTFSSGVTFANGSWNAVGDDVYFGDANVSGGFCIKGNNASSRIVLFDRNSSYSNGFYIDELDGNALKLNNTTYGAERWGSVTAMSSQSLSANGYVKYNNGLIIQWGYSSVDNNQVTLPTPFSNTNYRVCATYMNTSSIGSGYGHVVTYPTSTTSFYANTEAGTYQWIAIGY